MAYDKVVDSTFLEAGLTLVGDSIRAKGGTSAKLEFPNGMKAAVDAIDTSENLDDVLTEQESIIDQIQAALEGKAAANVEIGWFSVASIRYDTGLTYKLPFVIGMTWREWLTTPLNITLHNDYSGYVVNLYEYEDSVAFAGASGDTVISTGDTISTKVSLDDTIQNEFTYQAHGTMAPP